MDIHKFRNKLVLLRQEAYDDVVALQNPDGTIPKDRLIAYVVRYAETSVFCKIIEAIDSSK